MPQDLNATIAVTLPADNQYAGSYELRLADCTGLDDLDVRKETGYSLIGLIEQVEKDNGLGLVLIATVVWLCRRREFAHTTFTMVAAAINWGTEFEIVTEAADDEGKAQATGNDS
jgi:hypothetical protein